MEQVRWRRARPALAQELRTHLLDQRDACLAQGMSQTEAEAESLRQMGDPVEVGTQLDRVHRPAPQWGMLALVGLLLCSGFFIQATVMQQLGRVQPYMPTVIVSILLGVAAMAAVYLGDYTLLGRRPVLLYSLGMAALAVLIQRGGMRVGGISYTLLGPVLYALLVYGLRGKGWRGLLLALAGLVFARRWSCPASSRISPAVPSPASAEQRWCSPRRGRAGWGCPGRRGQPPWPLSSWY